MPTIDIDIAEFEKLLGVTFCGNTERLDDLLAFVKAEIKLYDKTQGTASIECKDTNRPDLWGVEGLARGLRCYLNLEKGTRKYQTGPTAVEIHVDERLKNIRPYIGCAIVKDIHLTDTIIRGLMHLQDKLDQTYGRGRQKTSIGIYDFDLITSPLSYTVKKPQEWSFTPLGFTENLTLAQILERHPKGQEYGYIINKNSLYPLLLDAKEKVLSMPPIINSNDLGRVTPESRNLLVEVTGTLDQTVLNTVNLVTTALVDRGGKACSASIHYPEDPCYPRKKAVTPNFQESVKALDIAFTNRLIGLELTGQKIADLLETAGLGVASANEKTVNVEIPCYRIDIMHQVDIVEDVAVAFGYNNIEPLWRDLPTTGNAQHEQQLIDAARELMVGAGYQEVLNNTLTNHDDLFTKMNQDRTPVVEIINPKLVTMTCLRNRLLPSIMEFLSLNQSVEFPQRIFELGKVTFPDETRETKTRDEEWLAATTAHPNAGFSEIKATLDAFLTNMGVAWQVKPLSNATFLEGRVGSVVVDGEDIGLIGEINPVVLEAWKLENPIATFEINLQPILAHKQKINSR